MDLEIPVGLSDLLQDFTVHVLREKPEDIVEFAANYFMKLKLKEKRSKEGRKNKKGKGVSFSTEQNGEDMDDDEDDDMPGINLLAQIVQQPWKMSQRRVMFAMVNSKSPEEVREASALTYSFIIDELSLTEVTPACPLFEVFS